jgi:hypothetical protein
MRNSDFQTRSLLTRRDISKSSALAFAPLAILPASYVLGDCAEGTVNRYRKLRLVLQGFLQAHVTPLGQ